MEKIVQCKNIVHTYQNVSVLRGVDVCVERGEILGIVGRSGAGKSTLLYIMGTLLRQSCGEVLIGGEDLRGYSDRALSHFRAQNLGFVFQDFHLLPELTALENVLLASEIAGAERSQAQGYAIELLERLGLKERLEHKPSALSGGEQQRVAIARALVNRPLVVFADEPTGNLDSCACVELNTLFKELQSELGQTFVVVTHQSDFEQKCDRVITLSDGTVV